MRFDRNNLKKVLRSPLLLTGRIASWVVPRSDRQWVFGSGIGFGEGGVRLSELARDAGLRVTWLSDKPAGRAAAEEAGFHTDRVHSLAGWWRTLRAGTVVVSHGLGDVNPYALPGAQLVQLWHGVPLKHLHRDAGVTYSLPKFPLSRVAEGMLRRGSERAYARITHFVAASNESGRRLQSAFGLRPEQLCVVGDPRDDVLLLGDAVSRNQAARALVEQALRRPLTDRVLLFAPTWRDGQVDPVVPNPAEWDALERYAAEHATTVIIRPHPLAIGAYRDGVVGRAGVYLLDVTQLPDITPALPAADVLVTDYSSIAYDYSLLARPMLYLTPDLEAYAASRGFYEPIEQFCGGQPTRSWAELLAALERLADPTERAAAITHAQQTAARVHDFSDGANTERLFARLVAR